MILVTLSNDDGDGNDNTAKQQVNEDKQSLCTCVLNFVHFFASRFCGEREDTTVNFSFSLARTPCLPNCFLVPVLIQFK